MVAICSGLPCVTITNMCGCAGVEAAAVTDIAAATDAVCLLFLLLLVVFLRLV